MKSYIKKIKNIKDKFAKFNGNEIDNVLDVLNNKNIDFGLNQKIVEALIFASAEPISYSELQKTITDNKLLDEILDTLNLSKSLSFSSLVGDS